MRYRINTVSGKIEVQRLFATRYEGSFTWEDPTDEERKDIERMERGNKHLFVNRERKRAELAEQVKNALANELEKTWVGCGCSDPDCEDQ